MIRHLRHSEIDKTWWDAQLLRCSNKLWYAQSWILDGASPGWEALVDDDPGAIMPLTWRKKWGIAYLYEPTGLQQLGVFAPVASEEVDRAFIDAIPSRFKYVDIQLNEHMRVVPRSGERVTEHPFQVLRMNNTIEQLRSAYAKGHRRNLKEGMDGLAFGQMSAPAFFSLFERTTGQRFGKNAMQGVKNLMEVVTEGISRGQCSIVTLQRGTDVLAAACFAIWQGRTILLKSANTDEGYAKKAMFLITDHWIERHAGMELLLDFAGSQTPSVARFNAGFGAEPRVYLRLVRNKLPAPLRWLKR